MATLNIFPFRGACATIFPGFSKLYTGNEAGRELASEEKKYRSSGIKSFSGGRRTLVSAKWRLDGIVEVMLWLLHDFFSADEETIDRLSSLKVERWIDMLLDALIIFIFYFN
jgi:hypothetical protein